VRKDKGEIDAITGATITSRAVCEAVKSALDDYCAEREALRGPAAPAAELGGGN
jgi:Na+-transporting NADH:ubiquinone oxidoreductase subunit NqrC